MVVELVMTIFVFDETMRGSADGAGSAVVRDGGAVGDGGWVFEDGNESSAVEEVGFPEFDEITEGWEKINGLYDGTRTVTGVLNGWIDDDEG